MRAAMKELGRDHQPAAASQEEGAGGLQEGEREGWYETQTCAGWQNLWSPSVGELQPDQGIHGWRFSWHHRAEPVLLLLPMITCNSIAMVTYLKIGDLLLRILQVLHQVSLGSESFLELNLTLRLESR